MRSLLVLAAVAGVVGIAVLAAGCGRAEPPAASAQTGSAEARRAELTNEVCPVMGGKARKELSAEYQGRTVYFCCAACPDKFEANPEKYLAKLDR